MIANSLLYKPRIMATKFVIVRRKMSPLVCSSAGSKRKPRGLRKQHEAVFSSGDPIPETGIYAVLHDRGHRTMHEVVMFAKDLFPECEECGAKVRFRVIRTAPYIFDDEDFVEGC